MELFENVLFVTSGDDGVADARDQALLLACSNGTPLTALIVCPELPDYLGNYRDLITAGLRQQLLDALDSALASCNPGARNISLTVQLEEGSMPAVRIIRRVLEDGHGVVIKAAGFQSGTSGFHSLDMELLRKCPCPVWLCRPVPEQTTGAVVAVAIDPECETPEARTLALRLLRFARTLADARGCSLHVVSCWDYVFEEYLRHNIRMDIDDAALDMVVMEVRNGHRSALQGLLVESGINAKYEVHHLRGKADELIPRHTRENAVDVLVMGTLGRTGIPGFIIGNTAENIVQKISCSLVAFKPEGFISPVRLH